MLFCQSIDVVITNDTFHWFLLSKSPFSQSEALLDKSRCALLECAIHVFKKRFTMSPLFAEGGGFGGVGDIVKEIPNLNFCFSPTRGNGFFQFLFFFCSSNFLSNTFISLYIYNLFEIKIF